MSAREVIETWFERVWHKEDLSAIEEMMAPQTEIHGLGDIPATGPEGFRPFAEALLQQIGDVHISIQKFMEDGDWSQALMTVTASCRNTGTPVRFSGQVMAKVQDNRIVSAYNHFDFMSMYEQLGMLPRDAMGQCLSGRSLG